MKLLNDKIQGKFYTITSDDICHEPQVLKWYQKQPRGEQKKMNKTKIYTDGKIKW